jgi:lipopolysaccharide heptosyltransferase II
LNRKDPPKIEPGSVRNILLIRLRRIGDIIMTTPAVAALKKALPQASLTYIVEEPYGRLVEGNPDIDETVRIPPHQKAASFLSLIRRLRRKKFDIAIDFHGGPRASRIAWLSGARLKVGYELKHKEFIYDVRVPRSREGARLHSVENHLNLVRAAGVEVHEPWPRLILPPAWPAEMKRVEELWTGLGLPGQKTVVLHIGAGNAFRDWGSENLGALAVRLAALPDVRVALVGSREDVPRGDEIRAKSGNAVTSFAGKLNLIELREIIGRARLFVGPDSGPMHVAASTSTPIVALFGPNLPEYNAPWMARATIIEKTLACRPCKQRECVTGDLRCLRNITVDEVLDACRPVLQA